MYMYICKHPRNSFAVSIYSRKQTGKKIHQPRLLVANALANCMHFLCIIIYMKDNARQMHTPVIFKGKKTELSWAGFEPATSCVLVVTPPTELPGQLSWPS